MWKRPPCWLELLQGRHLPCRVSPEPPRESFSRFPPFKSNQLYPGSFLAGLLRPPFFLPPCLNFVLVPRESRDWLPVAMTIAIKGASRMTPS